MDFSGFYSVLSTKGFLAANLLTAKRAQGLPLTLANVRVLPISAFGQQAQCDGKHVIF